MIRWSAEAWADLWAAVGFLTTLPTPRAAFPAAGLGRAAYWFPLVGLGIGLALVTLRWLALRVFDPWLAGALTVAAWAALTGALHLDGLADCCDALLAPASRERRLEILRDPRVGSFGAVGLVLTLLLKAGAAAQVALAALLLAPVWARLLLLIAARQPQARPEGMGAAFAAGLTPRRLGLAALVPVLLIPVSGMPLRGMAAAAVAAAVTAGVLRLAQARLGGVTGDVYGLVVELSELAVLLVFAAHAPI
jgi:adenosylcobinamide-GDP ribazoletransferase